MAKSMNCAFNCNSILTTIIPIVCFSPLYLLDLQNPVYTIILRVVTTILILSMNIGFFFHPWKITYKNQMLFIRTIAKTYKVKLRWCCYDDFNPDRLQDSKQIIGSNGAWGHFGIYEDYKIGRYRVCATQADNLIIIYRDGHLPLVVNDFMPLFDYSPTI